MERAVIGNGGGGEEKRSGGKTHFIVPSVQRPEIDSAKEPVGRGMLLVQLDFFPPPFLCLLLLRFHLSYHCERVLCVDP